MNHLTVIINVIQINANVELGFPCMHSLRKRVCCQCFWTGGHGERTDWTCPGKGNESTSSLTPRITLISLTLKSWKRWILTEITGWLVKQRRTDICRSRERPESLLRMVSTCGVSSSSLSQVHEVLLQLDDFVGRGRNGRPHRHSHSSSSCDKWVEAGGGWGNGMRL